MGGLRPLKAPGSTGYLLLNAPRVDLTQNDTHLRSHHTGAVLIATASFLSSPQVEP
ncbi:hypothetical protein I79_006668 [Cricetulus griseus]|uniref:Uncharacterized protein n=1 Tax=Cricetulus griseus TaxID=10029 RepID=G3H8G8_CRIGR|nr:hypothetical protein I79_006668 [Cricetulus griseus]